MFSVETAVLVRLGTVSQLLKNNFQNKNPASAGFLFSPDFIFSREFVGYTLGMSITPAIFIFVFGTIIGSFLNVVVLRYGTGQSLGGRSKCAITGKPLRWFELIPIVSFVIQGGRSRHGGGKLSWQYPLVEFFTGIGFVAIASKLAPLMYLKPEAYFINVLFYFAIYSFITLIFVYDWHHKIIPNDFVYPLMVLSIVPVIFSSHPLAFLATGPIVALPMLVLWFLTRGRGMGFGDVKLALPVGWLLGLSAGFASLLLAFWIGAIFGIASMLVHGAKWKSEIPFGPFMIIGVALAFLYNIDMSSIAWFFGSLL